jgi:hypothetical protein
MKKSKVAPLLLVASIGAGAGAASVAIASTAGAAIHQSMAPVTKMGKLAKIDSKSSFTFDVGMHHYIVKVDAMTHIKLDDKSVKLSKLKVGDTLTVHGPLEMGEIDATSITVQM